MPWGISDKHRFVFVHIPKTAGTSICSSWDGAILKDHMREHGVLGGTHKTIGEIRDEYPRTKGYRALAVVRNPLDRFVSAVCFRRLAPVTCIDWSDIPLAQHQWVDDSVEVVKYENLKPGLEAFFDSVGFTWNGKMPTHRKTGKGDWRGYLLQTEVDRVCRIYDRDFLKFGYRRG